MSRYDHLLVGMNLTEGDRARSRYVDLIARLCGAEEVHFIHVTEHLDLPDDLHDEYPQIRAGQADAARKRLQETACDAFEGPDGVKVTCEVLEGARIKELLQRTRDLDTDLVVVGRKAGEQEPGELAEKLARKAPCSVLFLPEDPPEKITRILVALDFSANSRAALVEAIALARAAGLAEVLCLHVYRVPLGYSHTGKSMNDFEDIMRTNAEAKFEILKTKVDAKGLNLRFLLASGDHPSRVIRDQAANHHVDLAIVGARGRTPGAAILLGSVSERLIRITPCPLLAVKEKGASMGVLEALFNL